MNTEFNQFSRLTEVWFHKKTRRGLHIKSRETPPIANDLHEM